MHDEVKVIVKHADGTITDPDEGRIIVEKEPVVTSTKPRTRMILNPNKETVEKIINRIYKCDGYCPCQPKSGDTRCPCSDFLVHNDCHCHLFVEG